jgi:protocatechuate 3,4-dioxygenase beta subunit
VLGLFGGAGAAGLLAACGLSGASDGATVASSRTGAASSPGATAAAGLTEVPGEAGGPFPADGSNGPNVLDDSGSVRSDIRSCFGSSATTATGMPLPIRLTVRDAATGDVLSGAAVYLWHCDRDGNYSLYSDAARDENYLRGVQEVDTSGTATFTSILPGGYSGRWPHIHFEVYGALDDAVASGPIVKTSQIALPKEACDSVYATDGYETSARNLEGTSLSGDNVFGDDGGVHQIASMSGDVDSGYTAALTIGV